MFGSTGTNCQGAPEANTSTANNILRAFALRVQLPIRFIPPATTLQCRLDRITSPNLHMDLLIIGVGMGIVGGLVPSPLHMIALSQVSLGHWGRALRVLIGAPLLVDGCLLLVTIFFFRFIPAGIAHYVAYFGGVALIGFAVYSLWEMCTKTQHEIADSTALNYASLSVALFAEVASPGTWVYWITVAGPLIAEGRQKGYGAIAPFFVGGIVGFYGAAVFTLRLLAWGAGLHKRFKQNLFLAANVLLLVMGISYLVRAYLER
jgi:hypothetical protein